MKLNRRKILILLGSAAIVGLVSFRRLKSIFSPRIIQGRISGGNFNRGHQIRDPKFSGNEVEYEIDTLIIGAGISGLSAGHHLQKEGKENFMILELENRLGGNSSSESNETGSYPLGAHYLPIPSSESFELKTFLQEIGVITQIKNGLCVYNEYYLCFEPKERLFLNGRWQMGLEPNLGLSYSDQKEFEIFFSVMDEFKNALGNDGKRAFAIPVFRSSKDKKFTKYDSITMEQFFLELGLKSSYLRWYINYCCKDDYGASMDKISAWAGIHYFAARNGEGAGLDSSTVLTWPEGNAFLSRNLARNIKDKIKKNVLVYKIFEDVSGVFLVEAYDFSKNKILKYKTKNIIYSAPLFTAKKIVEISKIKKQLKRVHKEYSPWMTANIELESDLDSRETPLCWDNVNYHGRSLGYIYANHQEIKTQLAKKNITVYWPLLETSTKAARIRALTRTHQQWCGDVISELEGMHEGISEYIKEINISLWGHAMAIPQVGFLKSDNIGHRNFIFAHTDQSGISIFEEGFYQGLNAAKYIAGIMK